MSKWFETIQEILLITTTVARIQEDVSKLEAAHARRIDQLEASIGANRDAIARLELRLVKQEEWKAAAEAELDAKLSHMKTEVERAELVFKQHSLEARMAAGPGKGATAVSMPPRQGKAE